MVFSQYSISSTNETDRHVITEILLKVALTTTTLIPHLNRLNIKKYYTYDVGNPGLD
jgi:hypothetical protein